MERKSQFILASASPRRNDLLAAAGYVFDAVPSTVDEQAYPKEGISPSQHAMVLAKAKALDVARRNPDRLVIGSDCVVEFENQIIGKPFDASDALNIVRRIFSGPHKVITAVAFIDINRGIERVCLDTTTVYPKKITEEQIRKHIDSGLWEGKAGAYGIQEKGDEFIDHIEGSFTNVMGMPMEMTIRMLDEILAEK